jgi:hypothetical protein
MTRRVRAFLVARQQEGQCAVVVRVAGQETLGGRHHGRETALHVRGASAVQQAVLHHRLKGIGVPGLARPGRYDVGVAGKAEQGAAAAPGRPEVVHGRVPQPLATEAESFQSCADDFQTAMIVGTDGGTADQFGGEFQGR